jgi:glycosyltransferase involved in cell wall biosynthesis
VPAMFFAFRDAPDRRAALHAPGALDRYRLFGLDEVRARGARVRHNLEREGPPPLWARAAAKVVNRLLRLTGGYGGDFASALASLRTANEADVVFATTDTVGIPLILLKRAGLLRPPLVYAAIGLPERLVELRNRPMRRLYATAFRRAGTIVAYAESEAEWLRTWLAPDAPTVLFLPFGVDVDGFSPDSRRAENLDVVSVGADPLRDFDLLSAVAARHPELRFRIVATKDRARSLLGTLPANVSVETDLSLEQVRDNLGAARVVALPVRRNSYTGATTVLLQAMAMGKPVVVSQTDAISEGYGLQDGVNCRLVEPDDANAFERALLETLADDEAAASLGRLARETVKRAYSWERYTDALWEVLLVAADGRPSRG